MLLSGAVHAHSRYSDGTGEVPEIALAAQRCGLDFLIMTDHDTLRPRTEVGELFHGRTLLLFGCEVSPPTNHLLAFGAHTCPDRTLAPQECIDALGAQGAVTFLAHPHDRGCPVARIPSYRWDSWPARRFTGIEVWNHLSDWSGHLGRPPGALLRVAAPRLSLHGPEHETLQLWDALGRRRRVVGIAGLDVHALRVAGWTLYPYAYTFGTLRCHVEVDSWPDQPLQAKAELLAAIAEGRLHFSNEQAGPGRRLRFGGRDRLGAAVRMGMEVPWADLREVELSSPHAAHLTLLRDGAVVARTLGRELSARVEGPGVYRAEARVGRAGRRPWAFTNPVYAR